MSTGHVGIVWNPSKTSRYELENALEKAFERVLTGTAEVRVSWHETGEDDPGLGAARGAVEAGADVVLAAGGDGTVRAVAEHLAESGARAELGIIPLGTGNLLARNLGVPLKDLTAAFERALTGEAIPLDIGWARLAVDGETDGKRYAFAVMAGFGIDAHMITETDDDLKDRAGWLAYVESLGRALSASEVIDIRLSGQNLEPSDEQAHTLLIGNCGSLQGGMTLLPDADPSDGELDLLVLSADSIPGWADTMRNLVWDNGLRRLLSPSSSDEDQAKSSDSATHRRITELTVELDEPRVFEVDGDALGETSRVEISVQPGAVQVR
ncbi:MAG: diacylglycerol kinase family lipid kinase [Actinobacteria bacterium]|nr:diacylglycerol kinase family lipid kinase [Actinomycetota bacterium]